jgi:hypothetical protein
MLDNGQNLICGTCPRLETSGLTNLMADENGFEAKFSESQKALAMALLIQCSNCSKMVSLSMSEHTIKAKDGFGKIKVDTTSFPKRRLSQKPISSPFNTSLE